MERVEDHIFEEAEGGEGNDRRRKKEGKKDFEMSNDIAVPLASIGCCTCPLSLTNPIVAKFGTW